MPVYNPYHFVPVKPERHPGDMEIAVFDSGKHQITHDRYVADTYSGRIVCRLTTKSPIFVGGNREEDGTLEKPACVRHFELKDEEDKPAIPATSLRGLISSIAETAANSALRVLEDQLYSFRKLMDPQDALSAIGMIIIKKENGEEKFYLRPLTLPTITVAPGQPAKLQSPFRPQLYSIPNLKVYIGDKDSIRSEDFYRTYKHDSPVYFGLEMQTRAWNPDGTLDFDHQQHRKDINNHLGFLIGQKQLSTATPRPWDEVPAHEKNTKYTRGILRVLGCWGDREDKIPTTKKHEIFIPYPENEVDTWPLFEITNEAIETFYDLADQRTKEEKELLLPFEPKDTVRNTDPKERRFRLKSGDLVYFRPEGLKIAEISLSSIWRGRVEKTINGVRHRATTHDFFRKVSQNQNETNHELLPFHADRKLITLAEQIFGFVQQDRKRASNEPAPATDEHQSNRALSGRVWFSHARMHSHNGDSAYLAPVTLKILDTPKPPSPSMYFKRRGPAGFIAKRDLKPGGCLPQGRKFYLHHREAIQWNGNNQPPWASSRQWHENTGVSKDNHFKQKVRITPVRANSVFYFHLDFDNLSTVDLGLLLYALQPTPDFLHKIGMGKSIGLGTIQIEPVGVFLVDRAFRYSVDGLFETRYARSWVNDQENWPDDYRSLNAREEFTEIESLRDKFAETIDPDILKALKLLGNQTYANVTTPLESGGTPEEETFRWFVINDRGKDDDKNEVNKQFLKPLDHNSNSIDKLREHPWYPNQ
ncbi:MAG: TIGR03986 family CRISPR-associated RAMP protein [Acidobacteria bacterium]|nr:TIGR03986 family CRISPR-associated RAMP protein [Acidobacteriota bacterium]